MAYCMAFEIEGLYDNKISKGKKGYAVKYPKRKGEKRKKSELIRNKFSFISSFRDS